MPSRAQFPQAGLAPPALFVLMEEARSGDVDWRRGRVALYVHYAGEDVLAVAKEAYQRFFSENGLGLKAFPSLQKFEDDIIAWTADLLSGRSSGHRCRHIGWDGEHLSGAQDRPRL